MIALPQHPPPTQTTQSEPEDCDQSTPNTAARMETTRRDPKDTATLADEVLVSIARLLGRQAAREWFRAEG